MAPPESNALFADLDSLDELIKKQQQLQELDKCIQAKQLESGLIQTTARPVAAGQNPSYQFSSVPGPASFQDATPIMFLNDSSQAGGPDGGKSFFNLLRPRKIMNPQKWPQHYVPFGLSQKNYKEILVPEFVYGCLSILIEHPDHTPQHLLLSHLHDLMHLSVFHQWVKVSFGV